MRSLIGCCAVMMLIGCAGYGWLEESAQTSGGLSSTTATVDCDTAKTALDACLRTARDQASCQPAIDALDRCTTAPSRCANPAIDECLKAGRTDCQRLLDDANACLGLVTPDCDALEAQARACFSGGGTAARCQPLADAAAQCRADQHPTRPVEPTPAPGPCTAVQQAFATCIETQRDPARCQQQQNAVTQCEAAHPAPVTCQTEDAALRACLSRATDPNACRVEVDTLKTCQSRP